MARVLIAEDDTAVREFVRRALIHGGHEVATAHDGLDALDHLINEDEFDLLITDIVMLGMDGIALVLKVSKDYPRTAILMTGFAAERQRAHNLEELIHEVVPKPFSLKQICDAAEGALADRQRH